MFAGLRTPSVKFHLKTPITSAFDESTNVYDVTILSSTPSDVAGAMVTSTVSKMSTTIRTIGSATSSIAQVTTCCPITRYIYGSV